MLKRTIFREYDVRGIVEDDLRPSVLEQIGRATATYLQRSRGQKHPSVAVARDSRLSSPAYQAALIHGLVSSGCQVFDIGMVPTPVLYFAQRDLDCDAGIVVTASHNPGEYNGLKLRTSEGPLFGQQLQAIFELAEQQDFSIAAGTVRSLDVTEAYLSAVLRRISLERPLKLVLDAGNGAAGPIASELFRRLGCELIELYTQPDGRFPNHVADPTIPRYMSDLCARVKDTGANLGIGLDGDGDRMGVVDETGALWPGDRTLMLFARAVLSGCPGQTIVFDIKCSQELVDDIRAHGGTPLMWKTGYPLISQKLRETQAPLAGEMSGHTYFADNYFGFDDGMFAGARMLELLSGSSSALSTLLPRPRLLSTPELRLTCPDHRKFDVVRMVSEAFMTTHEVVDLDGARIQFRDGWGLIRASNTQPALVARFEAASEDRLSAIIAEVHGVLDRIPDLKLNLIAAVEMDGGDH